MQCNIVGCHILNIEFLSAIKRVEAAQAQGQFSGAGARAGLEIPAKRSHATQFHITSHSFTLRYRAAWSGLVEGRSLLETLWPSSATLDFLKLCTSWRTPVTSLPTLHWCVQYVLRCAMLCAPLQNVHNANYSAQIGAVAGQPWLLWEGRMLAGEIHIFQCLQSSSSSLPGHIIP